MILSCENLSGNVVGFNIVLQPFRSEFSCLKLHRIWTGIENFVCKILQSVDSGLSPSDQRIQLFPATYKVLRSF